MEGSSLVIIMATSAILLASPIVETTPVSPEDVHWTPAANGEQHQLVQVPLGLEDEDTAAALYADALCQDDVGCWQKQLELAQRRLAFAAAAANTMVKRGRQDAMLVPMRMGRALRITRAGSNGRFGPRFTKKNSFGGLRLTR